jgi:hypothetical protein
MKLSENFDFLELTATDFTNLQEINHIEANQYIPALTQLAELLEQIRAKFGPFKISSGFRGPELNAKVGGVSTSQHCVGQAADLVRSDWDWDTLDNVVNWIKKESGLKFGQCIRENHNGHCWMHISTGEKCEALDYKTGVYSIRP